MATVVTRYVNAASAGGDGTTQALTGANAAYASLNAALAAEQADLVTADQQLDIICEGSTADTTRVTTDAQTWTTDATRFVRIKAGASDRHPGFWSTSVYRLAPSAAGQAFRNSTLDHLEIDGLQITTSGTGGGFAVVEFQTGLGAGFQRMLNCIVENNQQSVTTLGPGIKPEDASPTYYFVNCIVYVASTASFTNNANGLQSSAGSGTCYIYNCTFHGWNDGIGPGFGATGKTAKNCISYNNAAEDYDSGGFNSASTNNLSQDTTAPGSNPITSATLSFSGTDDFRLAAGDTAALDAGTSLSADANYAFSTDHIGTSRPQGSQWDVGANERIAAGGLSRAVAMYYYQHTLRG